MTRARSRAEQKLATRARLLSVARRLFAERGYDATSIALVCRRARVTHGAIYHHFPGKQELFEAVLKDVAEGLRDAIALATEHLSGWAKLERACEVYLERCADPDVLAIFLRDGPRVLPRERFDAIDHAASAPLVIALLQEAVEAGVLRQQPVELLARVLGAAFAEAGSAIATAEDREQTHRDLRLLFSRWLGSLRP